MNTCLHCHAATQPEAKFCPKCGQPLKQTTSSLRKAASMLSAPLVRTGERPAEVNTRQFAMPFADQSRLPTGTRCQNDRYEVVVCLAEASLRNTYLVKDRQLRSCPQCQRHDLRSSNFCEYCGVPLTEYFFLLLEGLQPSAVEQEVNALRFQCRHPGLVNLYQVFTEQPLGQSLRTYLLLDPVIVEREAPGGQKGKRLATLAPITPAQATAWLGELARTLDYVHSKQAWLPKLNLQQILLVDQQIRLTGLEQLTAFSPAELASITAQETRLFVQLWQELVGSQSLPASVTRILQKGQSHQPYPTPHAFLAALATCSQTGLPTTTPLQLQVGSLTDLGLVRALNEDSMYILAVDQYLNSNNVPIRLYALADGMGGHAAGETASQLALNHLSLALLAGVQPMVTGSAQPPQLDYAHLLKQACLQAAKAVYDQARQLHVDMGTTLVAVLVDLATGNVYAANIGDSRLYKINRASITQITRDHSMVQLLVEKQQLTPEQARSHPQANLIYRTLGEKPIVEVDIFPTTLRMDEQLLLCSDGLSGQVNDQQIHQVVVNSATPQSACQALVKLAHQAGGPDNITVIIIKVNAT